MADIFTDTAEDPAENTTFSDGSQELGETSEQDPTASDLPVQSEQTPVEDQTALSDTSGDPANEDVSAGVETVQETDSIEQIDYTELLAQQNQYLESLLAETRETNERLSDLNHAAPVMIFMFSFVVGVLLVQILSSYLRV